MSDQFERFGLLSDAINSAIDARLRTLMSGLPGIVSQDGDGHTASAISAILGVVRADDGTLQQVPMPALQSLPIHFAGGGSVVSTHPITSGDEGIILFLARAIDAWHENGGQQAPTDTRQHHMSDAVFMGGLRSDPNKLANVSNTSIQHRSKDGKTTHDVDPSAGITTKVVAASDTSSNPFADATAYHSTNHSGGAISETSTDGTALHTRTVNPADGHQITVTKSGKTHTITMNPDDGISIASNVAVALSAPPGMLGLPAGGIGGGALATGAAATNVGALGGDLSGTLPDPEVVGILHVTGANALVNAANDSAAASAGVLVGGLYRNGSVLMVRVA